MIASRAVAFHWIVGTALLVAFPLVVTLNSTISLGTSALCYAAVASGLSMLYGQVGILALSQPALWSVGSYATFILMGRFDVSFWLSVPIAAAAAFLAGLVTALPAFRLRGHHLLIVTFLVTELVVIVARHWRSVTGGDIGLVMTKLPEGFLGIQFNGRVSFYYLALAALLISLGIHQLVASSRFGLKLRSIRENRDLAEAVGLNSRLLIFIAFGISGLSAAIGGSVLAIQLKNINPAGFGEPAVLLTALIVLLGGSRGVWGAVVGAWLIVFLPELLDLSPNGRNMAYGIVLVIVILVFPSGLSSAPSAILARLRSLRSFAGGGTATHGGARAQGDAA